MRAGDYDEMIQDFLDGKLEDKELEQFNEHLKNDPELENEVKSLQEVEMGLRSVGAEKFKNEVNSWEKEYSDNQTKDKGKVISLRTYFSIAASVVILVAAGIYFTSIGGSDFETLYADNFTPYEDMILVRGDTDNTINMELSQGMSAYNDQDYSIATQKLSSYLFQNPEQYGVALYLATAQMELKDFENAAANFELAANDPLFKQQAQWYLALLYLKNNQIDQAKSSLLNISQQEGHYKSNDAKTLLLKLK